jgi:ABC-type phosphate transport system auxiliary subunit
MNNYLTTESNEELIRKENLQQRHYQLQNELQALAQELPKYSFFDLL